MCKKVIAFGSENYRLTYKLLGEAVMYWTGTTTYLGVIMQSNPTQKRQSFKNSGKNQAHSRTSSTRRTVTGLHQLVPPNTGVHWHCVGPNISQWNWISGDAKTGLLDSLPDWEDERDETVIEVCSELGLQPLKERRRNHRLSLLMKILHYWRYQ